uniref:Transmembrane protein 234 homolog n=1 Tax=Populus trichocarpa TaxID=3694 RepID=A0A3N7G6Y1_POPTR|eukprot:XP_024445563.1 transmembrane protein 234 homolog isoform X1 [Populus trichocarpa]
MGGGDIEKMITIGLVWGATNALIRRGALLWDHQSLKSSSSSSSSLSSPPKFHQKLLSSLKSWLSLLIFWQYSLPFLLNLSASAIFFAILSDTPISLAVPVTNATTFAATAVFGMLLGEDTRVDFALLGTVECWWQEKEPKFPG